MSEVPDFAHGASGFTWAACGAMAAWHDALLVGWRGS